MRVRRARTAVAWVFAVNGLGIASWLSRLPAIRDTLGLAPGRLALVLIVGSLGAVLALPLSGLVVHWLRPAGTVRGAGLLCLLGIALAGVAGGGLLGGVPLLAVGLFAFGVGNALWDVAMNVEAAQVEQLLGRPIMPRFHAAFSLGTVAGALLGAAAAELRLSVTVHLCVVAAAVAVVVLASVRHFVPVAVVPAARARSLAAWSEPRTLMLGGLALGMAMCEGSANDWLALGLVDGYAVSHAVGAVGFGIFVLAMTAGRVTGPAVLERYGRVLALRGGALLVLTGVLLFVAGGRLVTVMGDGPALAVAVVGALAWGAGAALGFPVAMSAASDEPLRAAARVSVVASLGYVAFLAGPPFLGLLGDRVGVVDAMLGVILAVILSLFCAGAARATPTTR